MVKEGYHHVAEKMFLHTFSRSVYSVPRLSCSPWFCRLHIHFLSHPDNLVIDLGEVIGDCFSKALVYTLDLLYQAKSMDNVKGSTLQFDSDALQVRQDTQSGR